MILTKEIMGRTEPKCAPGISIWGSCISTDHMIRSLVMIFSRMRVTNTIEEGLPAIQVGEGQTLGRDHTTENTLRLLINNGKSQCPLDQQLHVHAKDVIIGKIRYQCREDRPIWDRKMLAKSVDCGWADRLVPSKMPHCQAVIQSGICFLTSGRRNNGQSALTIDVSARCWSRDNPASPMQSTWSHSKSNHRANMSPVCLPGVHELKAARKSKWVACPSWTTDFSDSEAIGKHNRAC
ncbi:hypothetical protein BJY00DRAFT_100433 [Aspergillus carlsbadensis]|nr:hypothetical protein BJY00DRAFT_100433 [Aspergillus carlsbadensis]